MKSIVITVYNPCIMNVHCPSYMNNHIPINHQMKRSGSFGWNDRGGKKCNRKHHLGGKSIKSELSSSSVTKQCEKNNATVNGRNVLVIDTPGLFDTSLTKDEVIDRIKRCIPLSAPGPHASWL